jgi:phage gp29-like protein
MYDDNNNKLFSVELMTTLGRRSFDTNAIINRMNKTVATSMLADFVLIGQESVGSFAMASSKTKMFSTAIGSYMDTITDEFNSHVIPRLFKLNGKTDASKLPQLTHGDIETIELSELAQYVNALSGAGLDLTGENIREHLAIQAGMPAGDIDVKPQPDPNGLMASQNVPTGPQGKEAKDGDTKPNKEGSKNA